MPRHPPDALKALDHSHYQCSSVRSETEHDNRKTSFTRSARMHLLSKQGRAGIRPRSLMSENDPRPFRITTGVNCGTPRSRVLHPMPDGWADRSSLHDVRWAGEPAAHGSRCARADGSSTRPVDASVSGPRFEKKRRRRHPAKACDRGPGMFPRDRERQALILIFLRKEVIQPQVPLRLPCYDFTPVADPTVAACPLAVSTASSGRTNSHGVTGGVYKAWERIHRGMLFHDY